MNRLEGYFNSKRPKPPIPVRPKAPENLPLNTTPGGTPPEYAKQVVARKRATWIELVLFLGLLEIRSLVVGCAAGFVVLFNGSSRDESMDAVLVFSWGYAFAASFNFIIRDCFGSWREFAKVIHKACSLVHRKVRGFCGRRDNRWF